jgi:hypothetical protein
MTKLIRKNLVFITAISILSLLSSCYMPVNCDDAEKSYKYWAGEDPPKDLKIIHGQYKRSPHFTLEYWFYMELKPTKLWREGIINLNNFIPDTALWNPPADAPLWFTPARHCKKWKAADKFLDSYMLQDSLTGNCYIYFAEY